ncbi:eukaryotic translation elongation factor 1 delta b (guanine nucleotide exchange protein) isoform X2 [Boleophthalmus pectinirostris]|uniref:eukaryotic translation elongation factor 1 delta b (guanine nucleotide exchange protein) isoform X2 n=2 Tax=Boleophthalmus pectinirostris TaxID=150288 RepID=UPI00242C065E|nr:eukaryotic translation elongation factor 1 delta b (guanine nucleotide exchange protein) isoform X2 [Boleophthalmus pectinirostris]
MSQKMSNSSAVDQSELEDAPCFAQSGKGGRSKSSSEQRNEETSSSPESLNSDGNGSSKTRRRRKRTSNAESGPVVKVNKTKNEVETQCGQSPHSCAGLAELQSECTNIWFERSMYERAESRYQCWLASSSVATLPSSSVLNKIPPPTTSNVAPITTATTATCHHSDQVACHHIVQSVWVNKNAFDQAERHFVETMQPSIPNSLNIPSPPDRIVSPRTPDEGYQSLAPTPATPIIPVDVVMPTRQPINGLPRIPMELLRDVWLEKPQYDRAEAAFYQNQCNNNSTKRSTCPSTSRGSEHPQSLVEEEEEEEEEELAVVEEKRVVSQCKAEVFHALHPIQEEEEPADVSDKEESQVSGVCYFLHPDNERLWLDKCRFDAAETRFYSIHKEEAKAMKRSIRPDIDASPVTSTTLQGEKYDILICYCSHFRTMSAPDFLAKEKIWFDKPRYDEAERRFYERMSGTSSTSQSTGDLGANSILKDIARARENIQKSLAGSTSTSSNNATDQSEIISRIKNLEHENQSLHKVVEDLRAALSKLESRVAVLEKSPAPVTSAPTIPVPYTNGTTFEQKSSGGNEPEEDDDEDLDLFGSDEDEEAERIKEERLKEYAERKAKKPALIAKSSILLDVKPWDDETDMTKLEECVRSVQADGLLWGTSKLVPVGYGIKKLQIACVVEDDKVGTDLLEEEITKFEEYVQSVDVAAFNKI